jgi:hypothetical protein
LAGKQGQIAGELGPEMIQAAQQRTLFEIAQRGGVKLEGLNRDQQIQALAGLAQTPMGQRVLGIRGPEQAMLLATQAVAAPETMARQAQAMRSEAWREALSRYNDQNVGFSGMMYRASTFGREVTARIGEPFAAVRNSLATTYDDMEEDLTDFWNGEKTEILTKGNATAITRAEKEWAKDPAARERAIRMVTDPRDIERVKRRANVITLKGTMQQVHEQIKAEGLTLLGDAEETGASAVSRGILDFSSHGPAHTGPIQITAQAVQSVQVEAMNRQSNAISAARTRRTGLTVDQRKVEAASIDKLLVEPAKLTPSERKIIGLDRTFSTGGGPGGWGMPLTEEGDVKDTNRMAIAYINNENVPVEKRADFARRFGTSVGGGDSKKMMQFLTSDFVPDDVQAEAARSVDEESGSDVLRADSKKAEAEFQETAEGLAQKILGGTSNKEIRAIQASMDAVSKLTDSRSSERDAFEAAGQLQKRLSQAGINVSRTRLLNRSRQVTQEEREKFERFGGQAQLAVLRGRAERALGTEAEQFEEQALRRAEAGMAREGDVESLQIVRQISQAQFKDINGIVDKLDDDDRDRLISSLNRQPVMKQIIENFARGDTMDAQAIEKTTGLLAGAEKVKKDPGEQAAVEAFQQESIKGFKGINETVNNNLALSEALLADAARLGIQTSRGPK